MGSEKPDMESMEPVLGSERPDLGPERRGLGSERSDLGSERLYLRLGGGRTDGNRRILPYVES